MEKLDRKELKHDRFERFEQGAFCFDRTNVELKLHRQNQSRQFKDSLIEPMWN